MEVGYLYQKKEKEVEQDVKKGQNVTLGADVSSILDTILIHEINNHDNPSAVLSLLKKECMLILGRIEQISEGNKNENRKEKV